ncbi:hypothetical protein L1049_024174 [Liquidambar formosana]|uniref:RING-type E3 ubiquitin transferase n=1 Tax=Liquidambar formosana TaxID=63359 RepID=A0AAP0WZD3_LIQFO
MMSRIEIQKDLDATKENVSEVRNDIRESRSRLNSIMELQSELSTKLHSSSLARSHAETQLEKAVIARADMVREIEDLRRQRDVLQRRIEFCREKDAIGMVSRFGELSCSYREYTAEEIRLATDDFSERLRLKSGGDWTNVYKGRMNHATVAIKKLSSVHGLSQEGFQAKVKLLSQIRHPRLVAMIGICSGLNCIVFEYMHNGSLRDTLFSSHRNSRKKNRTLRWPDRIRIAAEVCSGLSFLHLAEPRPIIHGNLNPSNILLDRNLYAKIHGFGLPRCHDEFDGSSDVRAFGLLMLMLLTGRNWAGQVDEAMVMNSAALIGVLDKMAGEWPLDLAEEFAGIAMKCLSIDQVPNTDLSITSVMRELDRLRKKAAALADTRGCEVVIEGGANPEDTSDVPSVFLCPIFQDVMQNPHVAADGFSYELEAIEEWLGMGHNTSPMTNLQLEHNHLTPNHTLRSLIQDWNNRRSTSAP